MPTYYYYFMRQRQTLQQVDVAENDSSDNWIKKRDISLREQNSHQFTAFSAHNEIQKKH